MLSMQHFIFGIVDTLVQLTRSDWEDFHLNRWTGTKLMPHGDRRPCYSIHWLEGSILNFPIIKLFHLEIIPTLRSVYIIHRMFNILSFIHIPNIMVLRIFTQLGTQRQY